MNYCTIDKHGNAKCDYGAYCDLCIKHPTIYYNEEGLTIGNNYTPQGKTELENYYKNLEVIRQ